MALLAVAESARAQRDLADCNDLVRLVLDCRAADEAAKRPHKSRAAQLELLKFFDRLSVAHYANDLGLAYSHLGRDGTASLASPARPSDKEVIDWYVAKLRATVGRKRMSTAEVAAMSKTLRNRLSLARKALRSNPEKA